MQTLTIERDFSLHEIGKCSLVWANPVRLFIFKNYLQVFFVTSIAVGFHFRGKIVFLHDSDKLDMWQLKYKE